jgi:hypothetical protein
MNAWEWKMIREDFSDLSECEESEIEAEVSKRNKKQRDELAKIFEKYCEIGVKAKRVHDVWHCGGEEPDYNPKTEKIVSVEDQKDKVVVETQMAHNFKFQLRYELVKLRGRWLIRDNRKCKIDQTSKWSRWDL